MNDTTRYLSTNDTLLWDLDRDPRFNASACSLMVFDRAPDWARFVAKMERITRLQPMLRCRIANAPLGITTPRWAVVDDFDLAHHLERVVLPPPGDMRTLLDLAAARAQVPLDLRRPLWRFTLFEGLDGGRAALLQLAHHAMSDGIGGMQLAEDYFDRGRRVAVDDRPLPPAPEPDRSGRLARGAGIGLHAARQVLGAVKGTAVVGRTLARDAVRDPIGSTRRARAYAGSAVRVARPVGRNGSPIMVGRGTDRRYDVLDVPFDRLRAAARSREATVNDAFLTAIAAGISRYHDAHGTSVDHLHVTMPISIRRPDDPRGGNHTGAARFPIPAASDDAAALLQRVRGVSHAARNEPAVDLARILGAVVGRLPSPIMVPFYASMLVHTDVLASNIPGFPEAPYICGARLDRWYALGPTEGTALGVFLLSHAGRCCIGVTTDRAAVPDPERLLACLRDAFDAVCALAPPVDTGAASGAVRQEPRVPVNSSRAAT